MTYVILVVAYTLVDRYVFSATQAPFQRTRKEWTFWAVFVPYLACIAFPLFSLFLLDNSPSMPFALAGGALIVIAAALRYFGVKALDKNFSASVEIHEEHALVDTGLYSEVRHPIYLGLLCLYFGCACFSGSPYSLIFVLVGAIGLVLRILSEERWLAQNLKGYRDYMKRTKRLVPWVW